MWAKSVSKRPNNSAGTKPAPAAPAALPAPPPPQERASLTAGESVDAVWKVIARFDTYVGGTNAKAGFLIAFNTFLIGAVALKCPEIVAAAGGSAGAVAAVSLLVATGAALFSLWHTFRAISPFLVSPSRPNEYHSNLFFGDVCAHATPDKYLEAVSTWDESALRRDLAFQAHTLAAGLSSKFALLRVAIGAVTFVQIPALGVAAAAVAWRTASKAIYGGP